MFNYLDLIYFPGVKRAEVESNYIVSAVMFLIFVLCCLWSFYSVPNNAYICQQLNYYFFQMFTDLSTVGVLAPFCSSSDCGELFIIKLM